MLGDMLELGDAAERLHRELAEPLAAAEVDRVFLVGEAMAALFEALPEANAGGLWRSAEEAIPALLRFLEPGDVVTVKGSRGVRVSHIVERLCAESSGRGDRDITQMLYPLLYPFADQFQFFNLFRYITFRSGGAVVTALLISFVLGPHLILWLRRKQSNGQPIRPDGPNGHLLRKKGTPTMGGFLILLALTHLDLAVGGFDQPLCVDRAADHRRVRADRLFRRLSQADQELASRALRAGPSSPSNSCSAPLPASPSPM